MKILINFFVLTKWSNLVKKNLSEKMILKKKKIVLVIFSLIMIKSIQIHGNKIKNTPKKKTKYPSY